MKKYNFLKFYDNIINECKRYILEFAINFLTFFTLSKHENFLHHQNISMVNEKLHIKRNIA